MMLDPDRLFVAPPDSSLLYSGHYDPVLVSLSVAIAIFASYAALLVSQHVTNAGVRAIRRMWVGVGGACLGLGIWAMHFVGMLAFSLPCTTDYSTTLTLLSMVPSTMACMLVMTVISRRTMSNGQLIMGGLLLGAGIGAMHYAGMAAMRLDGLIRYDLRLFVLSIVVAVTLATLALWIRFRLQALAGRWSRWVPGISAVVIGLAVSGMHYTAMAAAYFIREGDATLVDSQLGATFLASIVLAATGVIIVVTLVASYVARPNLLSLGHSYKIIGVLVAGWGLASWLSANYYYELHAANLYQHALESARQEARNTVGHIDDSLRLLQTVPLLLSRQSDTQRILRRHGGYAAPSSLPYETRKQQWTRNAELADLNRTLRMAATDVQADVIWLINAAGDTVAASNFDRADSFVGSNYSQREYFLQARAGLPWRQYALGLTSRVAGLYYSHPVFAGNAFIGVVVVKRNISTFAAWMRQAQAFITDANGVIIQAFDKSFEFRSLPDSAVDRLSVAQRHMQYGKGEFDELKVAAWHDKAYPFAVSIDDSKQPFVLVSRTFADGMMTLHVPRALEELQQIRTEKFGLFILIAAAGSMLIVAVSAVVLYLRESRRAEVDLRVAATAFESQEAMMITDAHSVILRVNRAFTQITGYQPEDIVGKKPGMVLKSGYHGGDFYADMWNTIRANGSWQGEVWDRRKNGEVYPQWLTITAVKGLDGEVTHYVGMHIDITQRKAAEQEIRHLAFYDPLTQLPNRRLLIDRLQQALASSTRSRRRGALLFIDLDNFKSLNDTRGHHKGDMLLQQVAQRLLGCVREDDTVARFGGDEFVVMLEHLSEHIQEAVTQAQAVGEKIAASLIQPYVLDGYEHHSTPSIGITLFVDHQDSVDELLKRADLAMYEAKAAGRNTLRFFDPDMQASASARAALESDLRQGLKENQFLLHYQIQVNELGRSIGAEALIRWQNPRLGHVPPDDFIPLAEETGLIEPLGQWVLKTACAQLVAWSRHPGTAPLVVSVNVSPRQFRHPDFVAHVFRAIEETGAKPEKLKLEITESLLLDDVEDTIAKMTRLKESGVGFALDDFGTGYSSLAYLKRLPLDQLKIDQSFVRDVFTDVNDAAIVRTIVALAQSLGLAVIAEGVETQAQRDFLANQGCLAYQGYLFGRPESADDLTARLAGVPEPLGRDR